MRAPPFPGRASPSAADPAAGFALLRGLALYLLSVVTAMAALVAWPMRSSPATALLVAAAGAAGLVAGEAAATAASEAQRTWRARGRLLSGIAYAALVALAVLIASAVPEPALLAREALLFAALQPILLVVAGALADVRLALANALALVVLAAVRGGPAAAVAVVAALVSIATFLLADNSVRMLGAYAARRGPAPRVVLRDGLAVVAPVAAGLVVLLWMAPPRPWAGVRWTSGPPDALPPRLYVVLFLAALLGAGAVGLAAQLLRRRQRKPPPTEDLVDVVVIEDEPLPYPAPSRGAAIPGSRGDVVRAYLAFLRVAARRGRPRRGSATPLEYAASLGRVAGLPLLTTLFMDARYGAEDPPLESVAAAEKASAQAVRDLAARGRRRPGRA